MDVISRGTEELAGSEWKSHQQIHVWPTSDVTKHVKTNTKTSHHWITPDITDVSSAALKRAIMQVPHRSGSRCSLFFCSVLLSTRRAEPLSSSSVTPFGGGVTGAARSSLLASWEPAEEEPVLSLPVWVVNVSPPSLVLNWDPPNSDPVPWRSRILKMSSDSVPHFSSELSWMRLQRLRASALAATPVRGQLKVGRVLVRLRGLLCQWSEDGDRDQIWGLQLPLSGVGLSSSSGDSDRDASAIWREETNRVERTRLTD